MAAGRSTAEGASERSRAIQEEMDQLADDFFGGAESRAPAGRSGKTSASGGTAATVVVPEEDFSSPYAQCKTHYTQDAVPASWRAGPEDTAGQVFDASDRNLLCMDVFFPSSGSSSAGRPRARVGASASNPLCVVGSADHGLKVFDIVTMKEKKTLFGGAYGHTEWVTSCKFLSDGRVLSGGMDNKLCLWDSVLSGPVRCHDLLGHSGSVSQVDVNVHGTAVSASYDRTLRVWDCAGRLGREVGCLSGHKAPVTQFVWSGTQVLSGDRQGTAKVWDLPSATCLHSMSTKRGQISALAHLIHDELGHQLLFGDQGGVLTVLDLRQGKQPAFQNELHHGGALTAIRTVDETPYVVTGGADKRVVVLDPRRNFEEVWCFTDHKDFIYSLETFGPLVLSGAGNGWLMVHDVTDGSCCYALGANTAAVREIFANPSYLIGAGDDGKAAVYTFA